MYLILWSIHTLLLGCSFFSICFSGGWYYYFYGGELIKTGKECCILVLTYNVRQKKYREHYLHYYYYSHPFIKCFLIPSFIKLYSLDAKWVFVSILLSQLNHHRHRHHNHRHRVVHAGLVTHMVWVLFFARLFPSSDNNL